MNDGILACLCEATRQSISHMPTCAVKSDGVEVWGPCRHAASSCRRFWWKQKHGRQCDVAGLLVERIEHSLTSQGRSDAHCGKDKTCVGRGSRQADERGYRGISLRDLASSCDGREKLEVNLAGTTDTAQGNLLRATMSAATGFAIRFKMRIDSVRKYEGLCICLCPEAWSGSSSTAAAAAAAAAAAG